MQRRVEHIVGYIEYLRTVGVGVSVHFAMESINRLPYQVWERLLAYNSHNNPYCIAVKACSAERCIAHQHAILGTLSEESACVTCYAGVVEYVFRIPLGDRTIGYVTVSGYRRDESVAIPSAASFIGALSPGEPPRELCDTLIPPLCVMLSNLFAECDNLEINEHNMISQYLAENHTTLDFDNFCRHFSRSRSYMSHKFKRIFGSSFSEYCNRLRLEDAKRLLTVTDLPVTEIALGCGFGDVSYFIRLFREKYGAPPLKYRKSQR